MACYHPSDVQVKRKPTVPGSKVRSTDLVTVPCGSCLGCRTDQARTWAIRLMHESQYPLQASWFVTLTYDDDSMPKYGSLDGDDVSRFLKRLRKRLEPRRISYYLCGEYGDVSRRPHYHACLFGVPLLDRERFGSRNGVPLYGSNFLRDTWSHGHIEFQNMNFGAARYVAGYVRKKVLASQDPEHYERHVPGTGEVVELQQEFARMSLRPPIGRRWIEKYWPDVYPRDYVVVDGKEYKPPRYYDRWMEANQPQIMYDVRRQRIEDAEEIGDEKLIMKEKIHRSRVKLFGGRNAV